MLLAFLGGFRAGSQGGQLFAEAGSTHAEGIPLSWANRFSQPRERLALLLIAGRRYMELLVSFRIQHILTGSVENPDNLFGSSELRSRAARAFFRIGTGNTPRSGTVLTSGTCPGCCGLWSAPGATGAKRRPTRTLPPPVFAYLRSTNAIVPKTPLNTRFSVRTL